MIEFLGEWIKLAAVVVFWLSLLFPIVISYGWSWWKSVWGWNICSLDFCIAGLLLHSSLETMFGINYYLSPFWLGSQALLISGIGCIIIWRAYVIYSLQVRKSENIQKGKDIE